MHTDHRVVDPSRLCLLSERRLGRGGPPHPIHFKTGDQQLTAPAVSGLGLGVRAEPVSLASRWRLRWRRFPPWSRGAGGLLSLSHGGLPPRWARALVGWARCRGTLLAVPEVPLALSHVCQALGRGGDDDTSPRGRDWMLKVLPRRPLPTDLLHLLRLLQGSPSGHARGPLPPLTADLHTCV